MDALTLSMLAGAGSALLKGGISAANQFGASNDLKLSPEQIRRLRELERLQARNALGLSQAEREQFRARSLSPIQAAEREVMARFGAAQNIEDIGQGAAFRQQQAVSDTSQAARAQIAQAEAQRDAQVVQQQANEMARLQEQKRQSDALKRQAALSALGGVGEAVVGAAGVKAEYELAEELYDKNIDRLKGSAKETSEGTQNMLGIKSVENTKATNQSLGGDGNRFVDGMVSRMTPQQIAMMMYTNPAMLLGDTQYQQLIQKMIAEGY